MHVHILAQIPVYTLTIPVALLVHLNVAVFVKEAVSMIVIMAAQEDVMQAAMALARHPHRPRIPQNLTIRQTPASVIVTKKRITQR